MEFRGGLAVALGEVLNGLFLSVLKDVEIVFGQITDQPALPVADSDGKGGQVNSRAKRDRLCNERDAFRHRNQRNHARKTRILGAILPKAFWRPAL